MKLFFTEQVKSWFGFTRRERRSTFILLIIICMVAGLRYIVPRPLSALEAKILETYEQNQDTVGVKADRVRGRVAVTRPAGTKTLQVIELNTCDSAMLEALPGIGPVLSTRIIRFRNLLGGYVSSEQLREVYGLSAETFTLISSSVKADPSLVRKINLNSAGYREIIRLPYFDRNDVSAILKYRDLTGNIKGIEELVDNKIITEETAEKVELYLRY